MSISVERLRVWLLGGAGLLVVVIAAFVGYAHYRAHRFLTQLPGKLGIDVRQETNAYTYSQTVQGRTIYTIHAAKAVQHKDGKYTLHDVGIVLYGQKQDRADRIYGKEFEYDPAAQVIQAAGEVFIDLKAPEAETASAKMDYAAGKDLHGAGAGGGVGGQTAEGADGKAERLIHIKTSGLVYTQKLGMATTDKDIEFTSGGLTGHAIGADYNSGSGVVVLRSVVRVSGLQHDRPVLLTASRAELDRQKQTTVLWQAKYVSVGAGTGGGVGETAQAQHVVVHLRKDGTAERLEAEGEVTLTNGEGGTVTAPRGEMMLSAENHPESAVMLGGVKYGEDGPLRQAQGESAEGRANFDKAGRVEHAVFTGSVHLHERVRGSDAVGEPWSERELGAKLVELALGSDAAGKTLLRDAKATGDARLKVLAPAGKGKSGGPTNSALAGDVLTAHFVRMNGADHIAEVHGDGHTFMRKVSSTGVVNTSAGDSLVAKFRPVVAGATAHGAGLAAAGTARQVPAAGTGTTTGTGTDEISTAVEQGHVVMTQMPVQKPGDAAAPQEERATAERAVYDGQLERVTLTGNVQVSDGTSVLWADRVVTEQQSGDATADGAVKASYQQGGGSDEPVHVLAARAVMKHDSQVAIFYGPPGQRARLWQGASQVDAPVLQFEQKERRLLAHGEGQGAPMAVHTVLLGNGAGQPGAGSGVGSSASTVKSMSGRKPAGKAAPESGNAKVVRVESRELVYSDEARKADFTGGVHVESADGSMKAQQAVVYLQAAPGGGSKTPPSSISSRKEPAGKVDGGKATSAQTGGFMGGSVERVVATGQIEMEQPGRHATGEQVVYTASDGLFVLTGTPTVRPKVVDDRQGTVTGASLQFHSGDESVVVSNGTSGAGQKVRTETRVKNKE
jgi:lipopolysaccharide export system protein LptA